MSDSLLLIPGWWCPRSLNPKPGCSTAIGPPEAGFICCDGAAPADFVDKVRALAPARLSVEVEGAPHVLANVTRLGARRALAVHLLNYAPEPVSGVRVRLKLGGEFATLAGARPRLLTPDQGTAGLAGAAGEFTLKSLDTYGVVVIE